MFFMNKVFLEFIKYIGRFVIRAPVRRPLWSLMKMVHTFIVGCKDIAPHSQAKRPFSYL